MSSHRIDRNEAQVLRQLFSEPNPNFVLPEDELRENRDPGGEISPAAVLMPLIARPDGMTVLFTRRTAHLRSHAGQISFPGGRVEVNDHDATDTALRETREEIGLDTAHVEILGHLPSQYTTRSGFLVTPVVGLIQPPFSLRPDRSEVDAVFEVPLEFLLDSANHRQGTIFAEGETRRFHAMPYGEHYIWGVTAGILKHFFWFFQAGRQR